MLERQLLVTKGKPMKVLNEIKRMQLELENLVPELRPLKQRIVSTKLKATCEGTTYYKLQQQAKAIEKKLEEVKHDLGWEMRDDLDSEDEYDLRGNDKYSKTYNSWRKHENKEFCEASLPVEPLPPSGGCAFDTLPPDRSLSIGWINGYNSFMRNTIRYLGELAEELVYPAGKLVIVMWRYKLPKKKRNSKHNKPPPPPRQRYFIGHTDIVTCLDVHPDRCTVASGQRALPGALPQICIWDSQDLRIKSILVGYHTIAIKRVKFCYDGSRLVSVGNEFLQKIGIWDWTNKALLYAFDGGSQYVMDVSFLPGNVGVIQVGVKHVLYHDFTARGVLTTEAQLGSKGTWQPFYCVGWVGNATIVGTRDGKLYVFVDRILNQVISAHDKSVNCICTLNEGVVTGGRDGVVKLWR
jgi:hypothetical protein